MPIRPKFKFYLKASDTLWYYTKNGEVLTTRTKTPLVADPVDWDNTTLSYVRHERYQGVMRKFAMPLTLCLDGAQILRDVFIREGYNGRVIFVVEKISDVTQEYISWFTGEVDFYGQFSDTETVVQVAIADAGLAAMLKAHERVSYEIPILDSDCIKINMDGAAVLNSAYYNALSGMYKQGIDARQYCPELTFNSSSFPYTADLHPKVAMDTGLVTDIINNSWFYQPSVDNTVTLKFTGKVQVRQKGNYDSGNQGFGINVYVLKPDNTTFYIYPVVQTPQLPNVGDTFTAIIVTLDGLSVTFPVVKGDRVSVVFGTLPFQGTGRYQFDSTTGRMYLDYALVYPATLVRAYRQIQLWEKMLAAVSAGKYGVKSDYLTNQTARYWGNNPWNTVITSSDAARLLGDGTLTKPDLIKTSVEELFSDMFARDITGVGIEGDFLRVERLPYFYNNSKTSIKLGLVTDFELTVDTAMLYNTGNFGYADTSQDSINGKGDPFTQFEYLTPARYIKETKDFVSPYIASIYTWEYKRIVSSQTPKDTDNTDNSILLAEIDTTTGPNGGFNLYRPQNLPGGYLTGVFTPSRAYNLSLMPEYIVHRRSARIAAVLYMTGGPLTFQSAVQNKEVVSKIDSTLPTVTAKANVALSEMDPILFLPYFFSFSHPVPMGYDEMDPNGRVEFDVLLEGMIKPITLAGFIEEVNANEGSMEPSRWVLHPTPDTDMNKLRR